jgi:hypothetical protein
MRSRPWPFAPSTSARATWPASSGFSRKLGHIEKFPRLAAWAKALVERPSTHSFPPAEFEATYRDIVRRRNKWISQFIAAPKVAAE